MYVRTFTKYQTEPISERPRSRICTEHRSFSDFSAAKEEIIQFICDERILTCRFASGSPVYCEKQDPWLFCKSGYKVPIQVTLLQMVRQMKIIGEKKTLCVHRVIIIAAMFFFSPKKDVNIGNCPAYHNCPSIGHWGAMTNNLYGHWTMSIGHPSTLFLIFSFMLQFYSLLLIFTNILGIPFYKIYSSTVPLVQNHLYEAVGSRQVISKKNAAQMPCNKSYL